MATVQTATASNLYDPELCSLRLIGADRSLSFWPSVVVLRPYISVMLPFRSNTGMTTDSVEVLVAGLAQDAEFLQAAPEPLTLVSNWTLLLRK